MDRLQLAVFASGRGSNFSAILDKIKQGALDADVKLLVTNNKNAGAVKTALVHKIPFVFIKRSMFNNRQDFVEKMLMILKEHRITFIALAGYMKKIPSEVITEFKNKITNIHPALLPCFGGKGMYGHHVHEKVLESGCKVTGVTVHLVDDKYDHGPIVAQKCVEVKNDDTAKSLADSVLKVEHQIYSEVLQFFAENRVVIQGKVTKIR
ncbi:MAG: phosphoribosylglycinamide formyltransferase [bacterium]